MSYIGKKPTSSFASATSQTFTGNNSTTAFTLNRRVSAPEDLEVFVSNVQQQPTVSYTIGSNGLTLTFSEAPPSGQFYVVYRNEAGTNAIDLGAARTASANTFTENQTIDANLTLTSDATSGFSPILKIKRDQSDTAQNNDPLGQLDFAGKNDADQEVNYFRMRGKIKDASDGTEDGQLVMKVMTNGTNADRITIEGGQPIQLDGGVDINGGELILDADADTSITADTDDQIDFKTGGTDRMSIKANGQIFIGNTSGTLPQSTMGVNSAGRHIIANDGAGYLLLHDNSTAAANNGFDIHLGGVPAGTATLFAGGSIFGGVENGTDADGYFSIKTTSNGTVTERVRINSDGKVGIGVTDPSTQLHIKGNDGIILEDDGTTNIFKIQTGNSGDIFFYTGTTSSSTSKLELPSAGGLKIRNAATSGPILDIGTTSTSVPDDGVIGGIDFTSGSASTVNGRLHCKQYGTSENAGYFSNELRAPNGNSLGEVSREFISQNAHGGIYIRRPMPANIFYYREVYKSVNILSSQSSGTTFITLNQNDYYCSIACFVDFWTLDTNYPTSALMRRYGLTANTHQGRGSWSARLTQYLDMGEYNTGSTDHSSASVNASLSITTSKSAGSNNGYLYIKYHTGSYTEASATVRLQGMFLNTRFDDQTITANL